MFYILRRGTQQHLSDIKQCTGLWFALFACSQFFAATPLCRASYSASYRAEGTCYSRSIERYS